MLTHLVSPGAMLKSSIVMTPAATMLFVKARRPINNIQFFFIALSYLIITFSLIIYIPLSRSLAFLLIRLPDKSYIVSSNSTGI